MKILVISGSHKGFASSIRVGEWIKTGILRKRPNWTVDIIPVGDGGEGTVESIVPVLNGRYYNIRSFNPLHEPISVRVGYVPSLDTSFLEVADLAGAGQVGRSDWNTLDLSSFGVGVAVREVVETGTPNIVIGLGGSIISDGGLGMAQALGVRFYDENDDLVQGKAGDCLTCRDLIKISRIEMSRIPESVTTRKYIILSDVNIPLLGPHGQAHTFGPQKKASKDDISFIESGLAKWNRVLKSTFEKNYDIPLAGAAGGLAAGLSAFLSGELRLGIDYVLEHIGFDRLCSNYDVVITGEGRLDRTTKLGKTCHGIAKHCQKLGKPFYGIFGYIAEVIDEFRDHAIDASTQGVDSDDERRLFSEEALIKAAGAVCDKLVDRNEHGTS